MFYGIPSMISLYLKSKIKSKSTSVYIKNENLEKPKKKIYNKKINKKIKKKKL